MKLTLFALLIALASVRSGAQSGAQSDRPASRLGPDFLKDLEVDRLAMRAQAAVQRPSCPGYSSQPDRSSESIFYAKLFRGPDGTSAPQVSSIDYRSIAPNATHEINPTVVIQSPSKWSPKQVTDLLAKTAEIYAQCGIRMNRTTVVYTRFPFNISKMNINSEMSVAYHMPPSASKPWLFFVQERDDNGSDPSAGGKSIAYTSETTLALGVKSPVARGTAWFGQDSILNNGYSAHPELVAGHELAHLLTDGDHQDRVPNILSGTGANIKPVITPEECAQMKANTSLVHKL